MPLPKHQNPTQANRVATAFYNFVPLPEKLVKAAESAETLPGHDEFMGYSGYFDVTLTTRSPLYVRGPLTRTLFDRMEEGKDIDGHKESARPPFASRIKNIPDFFHTRRENNDPGAPVIPGSSLRGMLRALVEIVSHGKVTRVSERQLIYRAVGDSTSLGAWYRQQLLGGNKSTPPTLEFDYPSLRVKGGYLCRYNGEWAIRPATPDANNETLIHVEYDAAIAHGIQPNYEDAQRQYAVPIYLQPPLRKSTSRGRRGPNSLYLNLAVVSKSADIALRQTGVTAPGGMVPAQLVITKHMGRRPPRPGDHPKHMHCAVYEPNNGVVPITIPREKWELYEQDRDMNRGIETRKLRNQGDPLFYLVDAAGKLVCFGSTMMFRLPYKKTILNRIPEYLRDALAIDYADVLFGYVREPKDFEGKKDGQGRPGRKPQQGDKRNAYASRVFVTDAIVGRENQPGSFFWQDQPIIPKILASPKPTSFQHYLVQEFPNEKRTLSHYDSPTKDDEGNTQGSDTVIRGHKRYWHRRDVTLPNVQDTQAQATNTQYTRIKPVNQGVRFNFRVHFENLTKEELGALCWALQPAGQSGQSYCHSLGMGKSLGLGKISFSSTLTLIERTVRYRSLFAGDGWAAGTTDTQGWMIWLRPSIYWPPKRRWKTKLIRQPNLLLHSNGTFWASSVLINKG